MQTTNPFKAMWQKMRQSVSPLDGLNAFYLGLESDVSHIQDAAFNADPLSPAALAAH
jgi:hypothetical protein